MARQATAEWKGDLKGGTGHVKLVLFDARAESATHGLINEFSFGEARPALVAIPPLVWHAVQCRGASDQRGHGTVVRQQLGAVGVGVEVLVWGECDVLFGIDTLSLGQRQGVLIRE